MKPSSPALLPATTKRILSNTIILWFIEMTPVKTAKRMNYLDKLVFSWQQLISFNIENNARLLHTEF
jgi:hypothetical protein